MSYIVDSRVQNKSENNIQKLATNIIVTEHFPEQYTLQHTKQTHSYTIHGFQSLVHNN
jgi:hypothetical protein